MALKFKVQKREEIPAEYAALYVERDGAWLLDVDGAADKARLDEFRQTNVTLLKQLDEQKKRFEGIDPDEVRKLADEKRRLELLAQGHKPEEIDKIVGDRIKGLRADWERQVATLTSERDALNGRLTSIQIDQGVITAATKRGLRPTAMADITARARHVFRLVNGAPRAFEADGQAVRYGKDGVTPMSLEEWVDGQVAEAPHLFESNAGGGSAGSSSGGAGDMVKNPWKKATWNMTEQMRILRADPKRAEQMKSAAGV